MPVAPACFNTAVPGIWYWGLKVVLADGRTREVSAALYALVAELDGSFSAGYGIGQLKREQLLAYHPAVEVEMMRRIKAALDPEGIFNPGKIL